MFLHFCIVYQGLQEILVTQALENHSNIGLAHSNKTFKIWCDICHTLPSGSIVPVNLFRRACIFLLPNLDKYFAILVFDILFYREGTKDIKTFRPLMREQARLDWSKADNLDNQTRLLG